MTALTRKRLIAFLVQKPSKNLSRCVIELVEGTTSKRFPPEGLLKRSKRKLSATGTASDDVLHVYEYFRHQEVRKKFKSSSEFRDVLLSDSDKTTEAWSTVVVLNNEMKSLSKSRGIESRMSSEQLILIMYMWILITNY